MKKSLSCIVAAVAMLICVTTSWAQPYTIYPVPHEQQLGKGSATLGTTVNIVAETGIDKATVDRALQILNEHGLKAVCSSKLQTGNANLVMGINGSQQLADKQAKRLKLCRKVFTVNKFDRHILNISADKKGRAQILILGETTDATFCGLASLEQILDAVGGPDAQLACLTINDYADIRDRGIIEGYYGVPYSAEVTKDLFRFMAKYKLNTYMYGAKSDPYHSKLWADAYPTTITPQQKEIGYLTQQMLADITAVGHATKVNFIWAIHPGTAFTNPDDADVLNRIMHKFEFMHSLGVRQFGVFVDDVGVPSDDALLRLGADRLTQLQELIDRRWNQPSAEAADTVKPLHYVPQLYAFSWVSREQGRRFFQSLASVPEKVRIYITGRNVWSVPNNRDLEIVKEWLGHDTSWWWNYPCNDNDVTKIFPMDTYANFADERHIDNLARLEPQLQGTPTLIINPMQQGELSKIALFSVADYAWNNAAFNNDRSWQASLKAVVGEQYAHALHTAAPCLRYFDSAALAYEVNNYKQSVEQGTPRPGGLVNKLTNLVDACNKLSEMKNSHKQSDRLFYEDLRPWLLKLRAMAEETIARLQGKPAETIDLEKNPDYQFPILTGLGDEISLSVQTAEPAATVLQPLLLWLREKE